MPSVIPSVETLIPMPITPLHFGPAAAAKAVTPKYFSFAVFGFTQLVIDMEPAYYMAQGLWPIHRFFHTYLGATLVAVFAVVVGKPIFELLIRWWNRRLSSRQRDWLGIQEGIPMTAAVSGALFGAYSHVLLDSVMHPDLRPFAPWSNTNGLLHVISNGQLNLLCAGLGVIGGILFLLMLLRRKRFADGTSNL